MFIVLDQIKTTTIKGFDFKNDAGRKTEEKKIVLDIVFLE